LNNFTNNSLPEGGEEEACLHVECRKCGFINVNSMSMISALVDGYRAERMLLDFKDRLSVNKIKQEDVEQISNSALSFLRVKKQLLTRQNNGKKTDPNKKTKGA